MTPGQNHICKVPGGCAAAIDGWRQTNSRRRARTSLRRALLMRTIRDRLHRPTRELPPPTCNT